jgi:hypothetical protein
MLIRKARWLLAVAALVGLSSASAVYAEKCADPACDAPSCCDNEEDGGCNGGCDDDSCCGGDPWRLFGESCFLKERGIVINGFSAQSFQWNTGNPDNNFNGPVTWADRANELQLTQLYIYAEKATEREECEWTFGWRADALYGTSYRFCTASQLEDNINGNQFYGLALPQFYVETAKGDWLFRFGHFTSPVGYQTIMTTLNPSQYIPYTYQYGEPFTHTGATATYKVGEKLTVFAGITRGWDNFGSRNPNLGFLGGATLTFPQGGTFAMVNVWSNEPDAGLVNYSSRYLQTNVYTKPINDKLTYIAQSDWGHQVAATGAGTAPAEWYGLNQYWIYKKNDCVSWLFNYEWFRDDDGFRVFTLMPSVFGAPNGRSAPLAGYAGDFYQITLGPSYTVTPNLMVRPQVRYDWYNGALPGGSRPFQDNTKSDQLLIGTEAIIQF